MSDPGEKATHAPGLFGISNPLSTGAPGTAGHAEATPGEVPASSNVFGTNVAQATGASGTAGGQSKGTAKPVTVTVDHAGAESYGTTTKSGGTDPQYNPIVGTYPTDTGAGEGHLLLGGRKPRNS